MEDRPIPVTGGPRRRHPKLRRPLRMLGALGLSVGVLAVAGSQAALASGSPGTLTPAGWQQAIAQPQDLSAGCYQVTYPSLAWTSTPCTAAPQIPLAPGPVPPGAGAPTLTVGDGHDDAAVVTGTISSATGSFVDVSPTITEKGQYGGEGSRVATAYSLQLNTQFIKGSPACAASPDPTCLAWQQFVYSSYTNEVFMQYWLITYVTTCPSGWYVYSPDCYTNSAAVTFSGGMISAAGLASTELTGTAVKGGSDGISLSSGDHAVLVKAADKKIHLATSWNTAEFNVFGDGGGGEAYFGAKTTLEAETSVTDGASTAPACVDEGFTAESNNLSFTTTPALAPQASPTIAFLQTNRKATTPSCATAAGQSESKVPAKPAPPHATAGNALATVTWTADTTGGSPISAYTVKSSPGTKACTWTSGPLSCTVKGLINGTSYTFTLVARNAKGASHASTPSSPVTPSTKPTKPAAPVATPGNASATVTWTAPATGGSPISSYVVTATTGAHGCTWSSGALQCTVTTLTNGHAYKFRVTAHNADGTSAPSPYSKVVKPKA